MNEHTTKAKNPASQYDMMNETTLVIREITLKLHD